MVLEAGKKPLAPIKDWHEVAVDEMLAKFGNAFVLYIISEGLRIDSVTDRHDETLKLMGIELEPTPEGRRKAADKAMEKCVAIMDSAIKELNTKIKTHEASDESLEPPEKLDFTAFAYTKLAQKAGEKGELSKKEFYRLCGLRFTLQKTEARKLLSQLERYGVIAENDKVKFPKANL